MPKLLGTAEAAEFLGIKKQNFVTRIAKRKDFPRPIVRLKMGPIWSEEGIKAWKEKNRG